ncbi:hypothetical protein PF008_g9665 [Phytophthora fragariae]|uniref:WRKY19-like zinc finger domain-containing protein n=1 Tax=Phytophthora fragariae TaxID=53985 RepID=A0A6G0RXM1_9STRA|nr:hypothetical protein PF003_g10649 [Phytophthora fragariae]KAE9343453.1 hypothetical protein PF008_g9665 [Phytophthora fragariae]
MVPGITSPLCTFIRTNPDDAKTISFSIRRGSDGRSSSIVLPRDHHLAKHLERLVASDSRLLQQPTGQTMESSNVVNALSSVVKYFHASSHHEAPSEALSALFSSLRPPSELSGLQFRGRVRSLPDAQTQSPSVGEHSPIHRRSSNRKRSTKHCKVLGCGNISVSRGLCRGHGGGRRCHYVGCSKSAQSRSVFCWAHGGGHRCEVESCMRSRKSKRFCADHVSLENAVPDGMRTPNSVEHPKLNGAFGGRFLPSIQEVLRNTQQSTSLML